MLLDELFCALYFNKVGSSKLQAPHTPTPTFFLHLISFFPSRSLISNLAFQTGSCMHTCTLYSRK